MGFLIVTPEVEKSNFYKDLESVIEFGELLKNLSKNYNHSIPSKTNETVN